MQLKVEVKLYKHFKGLQKVASEVMLLDQVHGCYMGRLM